MNAEQNLGFIARMVELFITSRLSPLILIASLLMGMAALLLTPREEEPQIVVPVMDVFVEAPGASADEVEKLVATPLEQKLWEIPGVEYAYSMSMPGRAVATVRYYVGEDREDSLLKTWSKLMSNQDLIPPFVSRWAVKPVEIDDVPIVLLTLSSPDPAYGGYELRRIAEELVDKIGTVENTGKIWISGGERRTLRIYPNPAKLAAHQVTLLELIRSLQAANLNLQAGDFDLSDRRLRLEAGPFIRTLAQAESIVIAQHGGRPVYLREVARLEDGPAEMDTYTRIGFGPQAGRSKIIAGPEASAGEGGPAVTIAVPKRRGANAVTVARAVIDQVISLHDRVIPSQVTVTVTRDYGQTANDKVNELVQNLVVAILLVVTVLAIILGLREAFVVAIAVPVTFGVTLFMDLLFDYTINRVTLFALVLSLGLLVDDPIVNMENIYRHFKMRRQPPLPAALTAVDEVLPPTIFTTLTAIVSFLPMAFITGMMGPYMGPMAFNVPVALTVSTFVAITITPWISYRLLKGDYGKKEDESFDLERTWIYRVYRALLAPLLKTPRHAGLFLLAVAILFMLSCLLVVFAVPLKLLPFDNKSELQLVIDMPRGTTLETTDAVTRDLEAYLATVNEITDFSAYVGLASPMDFNAMARRYYLRRGAHQSDIRINLVHKLDRDQQSHQIALRIRPAVERIAARHGANVKIVETPPGPPVLSTVVAEVYGPPGGSYADLVVNTKKVRQEFDKLDSLVDVDDFVDAPQTLLHYHLDQSKAALHGITVQQTAKTLAAALDGAQISILHATGERFPAPIVVRLTRPLRSVPETLLILRVRAQDGHLIPLGEVGHFEREAQPTTRFHKNLQPVNYVVAELAGHAPVEAVIALTRAFNERPLPEGYDVTLRGEGEWKITVDVFRDLGIGFGAALLLIYVLLVIQTNSLGMPGVIMLAIPLTIIGIMPGFGLLNMLPEPIGPYPNPVFFTATAMIGMIALAGIVVRNSILLIDFTERLRSQGISLREALIEAGAVRFRPILLTAFTTLSGAVVMTLDPIFSGLAWSFIFGIFASTSFTLLVIPVVYWLLSRTR
ncbi:MAG: efflux RND transporter permease subunit [Methylohalobius crimeensis]